jgi:multiple antibiotic resistance protein
VEYLELILKGVLLITLALFPIVNPIGSAPFFLALTTHCTPRERLLLSWRIAFNSFFLLLGSMVIGSHVLSFFGVSLPIVQVGGGLVVLASGWTMLRQDGEHEEIQRTTARQDPTLKAFYPLTLPLTVGPGSISVAITLGANARHSGGGPVLLALVAALAGSLLLSLTVFLCYAFADRVAARLGAAGMTVLEKLSSFLLTCIGLQIMWNGIRALVKAL